MDTSRLIFEWSFVILILLGLTYAAIVIKNEKDAYKESSKDIEFFNYRLFIPSWWSKKEDTPNNEFIYERTDTRYDWKCSIKWVKGEYDESAKDIADLIIKERGIEFDEDRKEVNEEDAFFSNSKTRERADSFIRIEGTASEGIEHRCYLDMMIYKDLMVPGYLIAISRSSILNGLVEGPYFEEVIKNIEIID